MNIEDCKFEWSNTSMLRSGGLISFEKQYYRLKRIVNGNQI